MANLAESKGLILFARDHKEKDKLVKIFTESSGKRMFFVKGAHRKNNPITSAIQPFTEAIFMGDFRTEGLSFLNSAKEVHSFRKIQEDIFISAYATYILNLVDAAIEDLVYDPSLYTFTHQTLAMLNQERDPEIITNIFEIQLMQRFGVTPVWSHCAVCEETQGKFDYSSKYNGILCERHWHLDNHRYHATPRAVHFARMFAAVALDKVEEIHLKEETKADIRQFIDELYSEYVGIQLKSKKFIDQMKTWEGLMKQPQKEEEME